jgi:site-specific DNA recombinase
VLKHGPDVCPVRRVSAAEIEAAVVDQLREMLRSPEVIVATWRAARTQVDGLSEDEVRTALDRLDPVWDELFPAEQARIVRLLVARVDVGTAGLDIHLRTKGLTATFQQLAAIGRSQEVAA